MNQPLRMAVAQLNFWVGDIEGNAGRIIEAAARARDEHHAQLIAFPELALIGYPPDDLLLRTGMPGAVAAALERIRSQVKGIDVIFGHPEYTADAIYNAASVYRDGELVARARKQRLPNYGVFDERRHFRPGEGTCCFDSQGQRIGLLICEDLWGPEPARDAAAQGATLLLNINASPYASNKSAQREVVFAERTAETGLPLVYVNLMGGQDDILFDGDSAAVDGDGRIHFRAPAFEEAIYPLSIEDGRPSGAVRPPQDDAAVMYRGLVQSVRDYVDRNGFPGALIGLSGGIDSAMVAAIAVDALGADRVLTVALPSRFTADMSNDDAAEQARLMGCRHERMPIEGAFGALAETLAPLFVGRDTDVTEENLQSRIRGTLLMALSNKFGHVVLTTGNKSEMAVGYATLYGDMCGGFAPLKDVYKTVVYELARWRNSQGLVIPERVITRPPTAELRDNQKDEDSLPPYEVLDPIITAYVEAQRSIREIVAQGFDEATVRRVAALIRRAEYKRRQAPPGPKVTPVAFGRDRRYPITAEYGDL
jgi:NAD+ synthase (glutamine-hydrolysing)